jgi:outer membrane protein assembly factor BamB
LLSAHCVAEPKESSMQGFRFLLHSVLFALFFGTSVAPADDWPQWLGPHRDGVWRETGLLEKFSPAGPKIVWRARVGKGYSGPAVVGDRVYITDFQRATDDGGKPVRATRAGIPGTERILCLSVADGSEVWKHEYERPYTISYPAGPRTTPLVHAGNVYALGAMGDLLCLSAADGKVHWSKELIAAYKIEPPVWGYASHLLVDGDLLYSLVGGDGSAIVAFNKNTGDEVWKALTSEEVGYSPPMIYELGGKRQLIVWLSDALYGLDPATGKQLWKKDYPEGVPVQRPAVNIITVRQVDAMLFLSTFYNGPMMLKVEGDAAPSVVWKGNSNNPGRPDGSHCLMATPLFKDGFGYAVGSQGELRCFNAATGEQKWQDFKPVAGRRVDSGTVFIVPQGDRCVLFNDSGDLILANLSPEGYEEIDRAHILDPVGFARGRDIVWSHPAFAARSVFARNDQEIIRVSLEAEG